MPLSAPVHRLKRRAKLLARKNDIPLHLALDRVARDEGYAGWSLLSSQETRTAAPVSLLPRLVDGDLLLLGARPGHGKTRLGLRLLLDAAREGRRAVFFTLEYTEQQARDRIRSLRDGSHEAGLVEIVASDDIGADSITRHLSGSPHGTVAVIDYLQILDQQRSKPPLSEQVSALRHLARAEGFVLAFISQIDRSFDPSRNPLPGLEDIRLPNPVDSSVFSKACFLHDGSVAFQVVS